MQKLTIQKNMQEDLAFALDALEGGNVILYPTDTVWGLGCDATNPSAVERISQIKRRPENKSMIILVSNFIMLQEYVEKVPFQAVDLMDEAESPLTVIYPNAKNIAKNLLAADGSIGIRIPNDEFCRTLISDFGRPIVSTSANYSGMPPSSNFSQIDSEIIKAVDYTVKYRQDDHRQAQPSNIVKVNIDGSITKIR